MIKINQTLTEFSKKPRNLLVIILGLGLVVILLLLVFKSGKETGMENINKGREKIEIEKDGKKAVIHRNGVVEFKDNDESFMQTWDEKSTTSVFEWYEKMTNNQTSDEEDETAKQMILSALDSSGSGGITDEDGVNEWFEDWFDSNSDTSDSGDSSDSDSDTSDSGDSSDSDSDTSDSGDSSDSDSGGSWLDCPFWRLSYCVYPPSPPPVPSPSPDTYLKDFPDLKPPDCSLFNYLVNQRSIISNTSCIEKIE